MVTEPTHVAPTCAAHPAVETRLTCSNCGTPICPRCMVTTAVGQKCPACARQSRHARGTPPTGLLLRVAGATVLAGAAGGWLLRALPIRGFLISLVYGLVVGAIAGRVARGRQHTLVGVAAAAGLVVGVAGVLLVLGFNPLAGDALLLYLIGGGITYVQVAGRW